MMISVVFVLFIAHLRGSAGDPVDLLSGPAVQSPRKKRLGAYLN
jgi:hypothetical protein